MGSNPLSHTILTGESMIEIVHQTVGTRTVLARVDDSQLLNQITIQLGDKYFEIVSISETDNRGIPYIIDDILSAVRKYLMIHAGLEKINR